ncbi:hypothetical protein GCM10007881_50000 [Mesorhizobium huakuii]|uniref:hypothetical protein n=1 Tax=Mesorhizobium TaxID=68287 RepID=UPI001F0B3ECA|nr:MULTISPECIES: hypothetical protein [Mesorhizobium]MCH4560469.1 hypothetical protein [Mesorhizobium jarvisii]GLQ81479.1 hypothetical protein GCM10007881_50000 [Mesorhizobium huakuii]
MIRGDKAARPGIVRGFSLVTRDTITTWTATPADSSIFNSTGSLDIGRNFATANVNGNIKELRIAKVVCRYGADGSTSVPTAAFPRS